MKKIFLAAALSAVVLAGCKPTEKNYREAYDAAVARREKSLADSGGEEAGLITDGGPRATVVDGDTIHTLSRHLSAADDGGALSPVNVAVGEFRMSTNARSGAAGLASLGYASRVAKGEDDCWYAIASGFDTEEEARAFVKAFRRGNAGYVYVGLPGPVIIR